MSLERQLKYRLDRFAKPDDATVRKVIIENEERLLAVYPHTRAGHRGVDGARSFKVPRKTRSTTNLHFDNVALAEPIPVRLLRPSQPKARWRQTRQRF